MEDVCNVGRHGKRHVGASQAVCADFVLVVVGEVKLIGLFEIHLRLLGWHGAGDRVNQIFHRLRCGG